MCSESNAQGQIPFHTNHNRNLAISGLFKASSVGIWMYRSSAVHLPLKGIGRTVFGAGSGDPLQVRLKAALGQRKVCRLRLHLSEAEKCPL